MDRRPVGTYFAPAPYIRQLADESTWGANNVVVAMPASLTERSFKPFLPDGNLDPDLIAILSLLTARVNRTHHGTLNSGLNLQPSQGDPPLLGLKPLSITMRVDPIAFIEGLARQAGIPCFRIRSSQAWVGGKSPLESSLALPNRHYIPDLLSDFIKVLFAQQSSGDPETVEALAFQLLTIHPLADGNGRLTRTLMIQIALRTGSLYPLYFAWRLMFDRVRTAELWRELAATGRPQPDATHFHKWCSHARDFGRLAQELLCGGLDRRALNALLAYGMPTESAILRANSRISAGLSKKIAATASSGDASELGIRAREAISKTIEALKGVVME